VAVRTEKLQILNAVVASIPVHVMERKTKLPAAPFGNPTELAALVLQSESEKSFLEVAAITSR